MASLVNVTFMQKMANYTCVIRFVFLSFIMLSLCSCSYFSGENGLLPDRRVKYKKAKVTKRLEIPPGLTSSAIRDEYEIPESNSAVDTDVNRQFQHLGRPQSNVLVASEKIRVERDGAKRWLVIQSKPKDIWPKIRDFWVEQGFLLKMEDPSIGIMETDWAENTADIPDDFIRNALKSTLDSVYSAATRDKYRVRLEQGVERNTTEVYLVHRGMEEVVGEVAVSATETTVWKPRSSDPELEIEMLSRVMVYLGIDRKKAASQLVRRDESKPRTSLSKTETGDVFLTIEEGFSRSWRLTGLALDRVGFPVSDRDRKRGIYYVKYDKSTGDDERGWLQKISFWKKNEPDDNQYLVHLTKQGEHTIITILNAIEKRINSQTANRILTLLNEQLK